MRDKIIERIYGLAESSDMLIQADLRKKSNDELIAMLMEVVIENYLYQEHINE